MLLFLSKADVVAIAEWELILNRAGIPFGGNEVIKLTVCPRHRAKYTTMYQVKVINQTNADYWRTSFVQKYNWKPKNTYMYIFLFY